MNQRRNTLLPCYFPTTVVLVDDDRKYLVSLQDRLDNTESHFVIYDNPRKALQDLEKNGGMQLVRNRILFYPEEQNRGQRLTGLNVYNIREESANPARYHEVSVIVVDHEMPQLKGLEVCRQLKKSPIKKLMLTGKVDENEAIKAFNDGVIDKFINKNEERFTQKLNEAIAELQYDYFRDASLSIIDSLTNNIESYPMWSFNDSIFIKFFDEICKKHHIVEYYLTDEDGSFLMLDFEGNPSLLIVKGEEGMLATSQLAELSDLKPSEAVLNAIKNREQILYLHKDEDFRIQASEWEMKGYLHPASKLKGSKQDYYYSYVTNTRMYAFGSQNFYSFKQFVDSRS